MILIVIVIVVWTESDLSGVARTSFRLNIPPVYELVVYVDSRRGVLSGSFYGKCEKQRLSPNLIGRLYFH